MQPLPIPAASGPLRVFPNPSPGQCSVRFDLSRAGEVVVLIHTLLGVKVAEFHRPMRSGPNSMDLNLKALIDGTYIISIQSAGDQQQGLVHVLH